MYVVVVFIELPLCRLQGCLETVMVDINYKLYIPKLIIESLHAVNQIDYFGTTLIRNFCACLAHMFTRCYGKSPTHIENKACQKFT